MQWSLFASLVLSLVAAPTAVQGFSHGVPQRSRSLRLPAHRSAQRGLSMEAERTFIMVKPDGVERGLVGRIITRFEDKGLSLVASRLCFADEEMLKEHYSHLSSKPFFPGLMSYMTSAPVMQMVFQGKGAVTAGRNILGATNPLESPCGTVRGDFGVDVGRNLCHGSDSVESAQQEIGLWFKPEDLCDWSPVTASLIEE